MRYRPGSDRWQAAPTALGGARYGGPGPREKSAIKTMDGEVVGRPRRKFGATRGGMQGAGCRASAGLGGSVGKVLGSHWGAPRKLLGKVTKVIKVTK